MDASSPAVEPCYVCGLPAELPTIGSGHIAGRDEDHLPICGDCLALCLNDPAAFWQKVRQRQGRARE